MIIETKLDGAFGAKQVARLAMLSYFPQDPDLRGEIVVILRDLCAVERMDSRGVKCDANAQCKAVVDNATKTLDGWRGPVQLKEVYDDLFPPYGRKGE